MKIGFIGCGNMAQAIIAGLIDNRTFFPTEIIASDKNREMLEAAREKYGIHTTTNNSELILESETIVFAVKPQVLPSVIDEIADVIGEQKLIISIVAGYNITRILNPNAITQPNRMELKNKFILKIRPTPVPMIPTIPARDIETNAKNMECFALRLIPLRDSTHN